MDWVRSNIRLGARLALIALALQFLAAFGHIHGIEASAAPVAHAATAGGPDAPDSDDEHHRDSAADFCAVCAAVAMAGTMLAASPPAVPLHYAAAAPMLPGNGDRSDASRPSGGFQPRGPPLS